jgi:hypothetical protein
MLLEKNPFDIEHQWKGMAMKVDTEVEVEHPRWKPWKIISSTSAVIGTITGFIGYMIELLQHHTCG